MEYAKWINPENSENNYWMFETSDENGNRGLNGGIMKRLAPEHTMTNYITVSSVNDYLSKIERYGGIL